MHAYLLGKVAFEAIIQAGGDVPGGASFRLHLQRTHLGSILPDYRVVALQVVVLRLLTHTQQQVSSHMEQETVPSRSLALKLQAETEQAGAHGRQQESSKPACKEVD